MAKRFSKVIKQFCEANRIVIPIGFDRHPASRYAVVRMTDPPQLVARTWFAQADVKYYLQHLADDVPNRILDFKDFEEFCFSESNQLERIGSIELV